MMNNTLPKLKYDSYMRSRGRPALFVLSCASCLSYLMSYQKDGQGPLLRCYLDRIHHPKNLEARQYGAFDEKISPQLTCSTCHAVIGVPMIYKKENRPAYHMIPGTFRAKKIDLFKLRMKAFFKAILNFFRGKIHFEKGGRRA